MGSYSHLKIRNVRFESWKSDDLNNSILILFNEEEKQVQQIPLAARSEDLLEDEEAAPSFSVKYVSTVSNIKSRLDFLGFTLDTCRQIFDIERINEIRDIRASINRASESVAHETSKGQHWEPYLDHLNRRLQVLSESTADSWLHALREFFAGRRTTESFLTSEAFEYAGVRLPHNRFPSTFDDRFRLRFELEACQGGEVVFDISDLVDSGHFSVSDPVSSFARDLVQGSDRNAIHLIVLTEGSTDKAVLEGALKFLRPELTGYVSFMDFEGLKAEGGASALLSLVRSFAAAGVRDRVVAIFDNDTSGCLSQGLLSKYSLPRTIRVLRYPDIEIARNYPTLGPSGLTAMDVNGSAAGIELYLGRDVLTDDEGTLIPVQWKGFESSLRRYQGEILDKRGCLDRFKQKLHQARSRGDDPASSEWAELRLVVDTICAAFNESDEQDLIQAACLISEMS